jgi:hypothetical protein
LFGSRLPLAKTPLLTSAILPSEFDFKHMPLRMLHDVHAGSAQNQKNNDVIALCEQPQQD